MITVRIIRADKKLIGFEVSGHADYDEYGKDIVCAGVSAITVGGLNAVATFFQMDTSKFEAVMEEGYTLLKIKDENEQSVQTVLETLVIQFKTIEETYSKYIQILE